MVISGSKTLVDFKPVSVPAGELDLEILSILHKMNKDMTVDVEVVEPVKQQLDEFKGMTCIF